MTTSYLKIKNLVAVEGADFVGDEDEEEEEEDMEEEVKKKKLSGAGEGSGRKNIGGAAAAAAAAAPPCCLVENCEADLSGCKKYHQRHRVCEAHAKAPVVLVDGLRQRFCQQCSRFHELSEFDQSKRSCRRRLAGHNERRRKSSLESRRLKEVRTSSDSERLMNPEIGRPGNQNSHVV